MGVNGEFDLIGRFFTHAPFGKWASQGVGDDCALIDIGASRIAVTTDMMGIGSHFLPDVDPESMGYKALAVNLSDLAAAGSEPRAFFLSIALPRRDDAWLERFSKGLMGLARQSGCALLGGDTIRPVEGAPLMVNITAMGEVTRGPGLTRSGAHPDDDIWVSGTLGGAYAALKCRWGHWTLPQEDFRHACLRMDRPFARNALGCELAQLASAAADVSDGFAQDLGHILERSGVAACVELEQVPCDPSLATLDAQKRQEAVFCGGDDYELVFTAPCEHRKRIEAIGQSLNVPVQRVGRILKGNGLTILDAKGVPITLAGTGFDHFA